jgi:hypothetical protein
VLDPLGDWIRKDAALVGTFSVQQPVGDRTRGVLELAETGQAAANPQVGGRVGDGLDAPWPSLCTA